MAQIRKVCGLVGLIALFAAPHASAQAPSPSTSKFFVFVDVGGQLQSRTLDMSSTQTVYEEQASLTASLPIGKGVVPDFGGGYRVWGNVFVGLTVSFFNDSGDAAYTASVPDPLFFDLDHLNAEGRELTTRLLAEALRGIPVRTRR